MKIIAEFDMSEKSGATPLPSDVLRELAKRNNSPTITYHDPALDQDLTVTLTVRRITCEINGVESVLDC